MSQARPIIELEEICRTYETGADPVRALADVTERIDVADHVAIMGPSGSGKSTLLNIIGCLDRPTSGRYVLDGEDVSTLSEGEIPSIRRHKIGFVFQSFHLISRLDAAGNVELPMLFAGVERAEREERVAEALASVGLADRMTHRPNQLSGGECQRVAIARAIVMDPKVILADEPTGNLDTASGQQVLELLEGMKERGITLLIVTHDPFVARRAHRVIVLTDGRIVRRLDGADVTDLASLFERPGVEE